MNSSDQSNSGDNQSRNFNMSRKRHWTHVVVVAFVLVFALLAGLFPLVIWPNSVTSAGNQQEQGITASYESAATTLSACVNKANGAAQTALANTAAYDKILKDAIAGTGNAGRYQLSSPSGRSGLYALFVQAYPDVSSMSKLFQYTATVIVGCQTDFQNAQKAVLDQVRAFNAWRTGSWMSRTFGGGNFPNNNLVLPIPGTHNVVYGQQALTMASVPIVNSVTAGSYSTGTYNPTNPFGPTPTPSATSGK